MSKVLLYQFLYFSPDLLDLVRAFNVAVGQKLAHLGDKVVFLQWDHIFLQTRTILIQVSAFNDDDNNNISQSAAIDIKTQCP